MHPDVSFGVPLRLLRTSDERLQLGEELVDHSELEGELEAHRRALGEEEQLLDLAPDALRREIVEWDAPADLFCVVIHLEAESGGELDPAQHAEAVVAKRPRVDRPQHPALEQIPSTVERVEPGIGQRIPCDRVDREVSSPRGFLRRHLRIAAHGKCAMPAADLRFPARQRHVDVENLVDGEALAHGVDGRDGLEQGLQSRRGEAIDLDVDVLASAAEQPIAHPSAHQQRASAVLAHEVCDRRRRLDAHRARVRVGSDVAGATTRRLPYLRIEPVGECRRDGVEDGQPARGAMGIHLGRGPLDALHDRAGDVVDRLLWTEP